MAYKNKEDENAYHREWYKKNKESHVWLVKKRKQEIDQWFKSFKKDVKCIFCGEAESCCIDFHHLNPLEKDFSISQSARNGASKEKILMELAKCIPVCSNCHRKVHAGIIIVGILGA